jgi:hypothetical protein
VSGALSSGNRILAWGNEGILALDLDLELRRIRTEQLYAAPTLAVTSVGPQVFALCRDAVEVWNRDGRREELFKAPQARILVASPTHLLVGWDNAVNIYQASGGKRPKLVGEHTIKGLSRIVASELIGRTWHFILEGSSRSELIDVSDPDRVLTLSEYHDLPELGYAERHGDLLIETDRSAMSLRLYSIGATAFI